jgi:hypothetical protein
VESTLVMRVWIRLGASEVRLWKVAMSPLLPWAAVSGPVRLAMYSSHAALKKVALLRRRAKFSGLGELTVDC